LANRLCGLNKPTVWHEFTPLAHQYQSINLGQGFPDWDPAAFGVHMPLATILAQEYSDRFQREFHPKTEIATAVGCTNALYCTLQGLV
jgi:hypothetical protein